MDGYELLEEIRKLPHTTDMSVLSEYLVIRSLCDVTLILFLFFFVFLVISATEDLSTVYKCLQHGADDYLVKPVKISQLRNLWSNIWKKKRERDYMQELMKEKTKSDSLGQQLQNLQSQLTDLNVKIDQAVDTPITAISRAILDLQNQANLTPEVKNVLRHVLHSLAGSDLYKPAFNKIMANHNVSLATKKWLMTELEGRWVDTPDLEAEAKEDIGQVHWSTSNEQETSELQSLHYNVWSKKEEDLVVYLHNIFDDFGLLSMFKVDRAKFRNFLMRIRSLYQAKNPYHNFRHGFDVTQSVYSFLTTGEGAKYLNHLEIFGLLVASLCHDVGHFGLNNMYLIATSHELAIRYNDQSVLENYHCALAFTTLNDPVYNIFENLTPAQFTTIRKLIIRCILATDLSRHMELFNKFQNTMDNFQQDDEDHRLLFTQLLIKSADISNPAKPFPVARYWADMVLQEFFIQVSTFFCLLF